jgi:hypothetical protein
MTPHPGPEAMAAIRRETAVQRAKQGLPPMITDPAILERVASVLLLVTIPDATRPSPRPRPKTTQGAAGP